jgi:uncharacterized protein YcbX
VKTWSVIDIWRFPVKSLQGERLEQASIGPRGIEGDRHWAIRDTTTGLTLTARREPALLLASARLVEGGVAIELPDGTTTVGDAALSEWLGRPVELREATGDERGVYETPLDIETESEDSWVQWKGPEDTFHDSGRTRVSIVSTATMRDWDRRRFRANIVVDGDGEDDLVGQTVQLGAAVVEVVKQIDRCVITTRPQPGGIDRDLDVLRTINRERAGFLGVGVVVHEPGLVSIGDALTPR